MATPPPPGVSATTAGMSDRGAGVARGVRRGLGLVGRWYGEARGPGGAGCAIGRLSWHAQVLQGEAARRRALAEKEGVDVRARGLGGGRRGGRDGERPGRRGVRVACGVGAAGGADVEVSQSS